MNAHEFDQILDECLDRLASGEAVEQCLARYPEQASRLEPLLHVAHVSRDAYRFEPSPDAQRRARERFAAARADWLASRRPSRALSLLDRILARPLPIAAVASLAAIALTMLLVVVPSLVPGTLTPGTVLPGTVDPGSPPEGTSSPLPPSTPSTPTTPAVPTVPATPTTPAHPTSPTTPTAPTTPSAPSTPPEVVPAIPAPDGNFVFYLSDAPNDIADFESLTLTIDSIELKPSIGPSVSITPDGEPVDIAPLQGDLARELWRGDVPAGNYRTVLIHVSAVEGVLASSGQTADVLLPSDLLRVSIDFSVTDGEPTDFVFDVTVHRIGNIGGLYILSPQADESGTSRPIQPVQGQQDERPGDPPGGANSPHGDLPGQARNKNDSTPST